MAETGGGTEKEDHHGCGEHAPGDSADHSPAGESSHDHAAHDHAAHDYGDHDHAGHDHAAHDHAGHDHSHVPSSGPKLVAAAGLNVGFAVIQIVVGLAIGSVVVLADAGHQVVDAVGLITALCAMALTRRPSSDRMSFGWGKADALGGFTSGLLLLGSVAWIAVESVRRLAEPTEVDGTSVIVIGLIAMAVNGGSLLLVDHHDHALSLQAARLHLLTDLAGSALVVLAGVALRGGGWLWIDPAASLVLCVAVIASTVALLRRSVAELLDRAPRGLTSEAVSDALLSRPEVLDVHHVHLRPLGNGDASVTAHVVINGELSVHAAQEEIKALSEALATKLAVTHSTLQLECHPCGNEAHDRPALDALAVE